MSRFSMVFISLIAGIVIGCIGTGLINGHNREVIVQTDTCTIEKVIVDSGAVLRAKKAEGYELVRAVSLDSLERLADNPRTIVEEVEVPVMVVKDSVVYIQVPMSESEFTGEKDSVKYDIVAYGYNTDIRKVSFAYPERIVTKTVTVDRTRRFGFGACAGPSVLVSPSGRVAGGAGVTAGIYIRF